jgi:endonuclease-8
VPEGDTVLVAARRLHAALAGECLRRTDFRVPAFATSDLSGQRVRDVGCRGKHLLLRTDGGITVHTHFKMEGRWDLYRPGARWRGREFEVRAVLVTDPWVAVGSRLGIVELLPTEQEPAALDHLGPDVLGPDWDPAEALRRLRREPGRPIGEALIDQTVMAGPGNVYKSEILFLRGVDPWTRVCDVSDLEGLVDLTHRVMDANRAAGRQVTTGDTRRGRDRWVYGRAGQPCRRCGTTVRSAPQGDAPTERITSWCPHCQPRPPATSS